METDKYPSRAALMRLQSAMTDAMKAPLAAFQNRVIPLEFSFKPDPNRPEVTTTVSTLHPSLHAALAVDMMGEVLGHRWSNSQVPQMSYALLEKLLKEAENAQDEAGQSATYTEALKIVCQTVFGFILPQPIGALIIIQGALAGIIRTILDAQKNEKVQAAKSNYKKLDVELRRAWRAAQRAISKDAPTLLNAFIDAADKAEALRSSLHRPHINEARWFDDESADQVVRTGWTLDVQPGADRDYWRSMWTLREGLDRLSSLDVVPGGDAVAMLEASKDWIQTLKTYPDLIYNTVSSIEAPSRPAVYVKGRPWIPDPENDRCLCFLVSGDGKTIVVNCEDGIMFVFCPVDSPRSIPTSPTMSGGSTSEPASPQPPSPDGAGGQGPGFQVVYDFAQFRGERRVGFLSVAWKPK